ncbi:hypothetical protein FUA48_08695 [Flavobacterium alkalisoli]|uniref:Uncharacterized protein n=1 Tax=Flavobacterium alkalisoli TaxID=2602769 RepID=A0A5B9FTV5_9FLAO|nr:hypothetical protein [Flavobacterium alkalisoli]QEE49659.1 hypothetical protein FUA48_08695 [Flavobacterium alkalisoli]
MKALIYITQLPEYKKQLERQIEVLEIAEGFTPQEKKTLLSIYNQLLGEINAIMANDEKIVQDVRNIEVFHPIAVN